MGALVAAATTAAGTASTVLIVEELRKLGSRVVPVASFTPPTGDVERHA
jgi:uridine phosphorylase